MVVCLDNDILQFIPVAMESLLKQADVRELYDFIPFVNQVVQKFKKDIVPFLQQVFMPIVSTIFRALTTIIDERDQVSQAERKLLQRGYFTFLSTLVNNNVTEVLSNQSSQNLREVLTTVIHGAVEIPDPVGQKTCFGILRKLVEVWGDDRNCVSFNDFIYKSIVPACFMAPMKPTFDLTDAQAVLALNECASCLKSIHDKRGDEFLIFLQVNYLPTHSLPQPAIQEFCRMLVSDYKVFHNFFKTFFIQARS
jgi:exportin-T